MPIVIREEPRPAFQIPAARTHQAVCFNVWDLGWQKTMFNGAAKAKRMVRIGWEVNEPVREGKFAGKRLTITRRYTATLNEKGNLYKDLTAWRGRPFSKEERNAFDLEEFVGKNCFLSVVHGSSDDGKKEYANVGGIISLPEGMPTLTIENPGYTPEWVTKEIAGQLNDAEAADLNAAHQEEQAGAEPPF